MQDFNRALFQLVQDGKVTKEEALSKAGNPQAIQQGFEALSEGMEGVSLRSNPDAMKILQDFKKDAETPKVMVMMPDVEVQ